MFEINIMMVRDEWLLTVLSNHNEWNFLDYFSVYLRQIIQKICEERRRSMSAVIYFVVGGISLVFALISFAGLDRKKDE